MSNYHRTCPESKPHGGIWHLPSPLCISLSNRHWGGSMETIPLQIMWGSCPWRMGPTITFCWSFLKKTPPLQNTQAAISELAQLDLSLKTWAASLPRWRHCWSLHSNFCVCGDSGGCNILVFKAPLKNCYNRSVADNNYVNKDDAQMEDSPSPR